MSDKVIKKDRNSDSNDGLMDKDKIVRFIFTGTPGSGKSSVIDELERSGCNVVHEVVTQLIAEEQSLGNLKPWEQPSFINKIVLSQKRSLLDNNNVLQFF